MVAITSEYAYWPYVVAVLLFTLFPLLVLGIALGCIARGAACRKYQVTPFHLKIIGGIVAFLGASISTALAFAAGFWVIPTAASAVLCLLVWIVCAPIAGMLFSEQTKHLIEPMTKHRAAANASVPNVQMLRSDSHHSAVELSRAPNVEMLTSEASTTLLFTPEESPTTSGSFIGHRGEFPKGTAGRHPRNRLENFWFCVRDDVLKRKYLHVAFLAAGLIGSTLLILLVHNGCVCNKPQIMTTWLSRKSETTYCAPDTVCFTYFMIGDNCSSLIAVGHFVQGSSGFTPSKAHAQVCPGPPGLSNNVCQGYPGVLRPMDDMAEDMRYIAQVPLTGLKCNTTYYVNVIFDGPGGTTQQGPSVCVNTIPSAPRAPVGANAADAYCFVGGGDYVVNNAGLPLLQKAMQQCPNAAFAFIGGDLGYDNNMRACYKRTDRMLWEWTSALVRKDNQCLVPLVTAIGNHDGGGYQWAGASALSTAAGRADNSAFYLKYYPTWSLDTTQQGAQPASSRDWTLTTHVHDLGNVLGLIVLDTYHILAIDAAQQLFLKQSLEYFRSRSMPVTVLYHVPAHPSVRAAEGGNSQAVLDMFTPLFDLYDDVVTLVFENHDHSYKRTKRLTNAAVAMTNASAFPELRQSGRGVIYSGDGALGAHSSKDETERDLGGLGVASDTNYVMVLHVMTNGSIHAESWKQDGITPFDDFMAV